MIFPTYTHGKCHFYDWVFMEDDAEQNAKVVSLVEEILDEAFQKDPFLSVSHVGEDGELDFDVCIELDGDEDPRYTVAELDWHPPTFRFNLNELFQSEDELREYDEETAKKIADGLRRLADEIEKRAAIGASGET